MPPRHFWWLVETLDQEAKAKRGGGGLDEDTKAQLMHMINKAKKADAAKKAEA
jgi:hypothetical protein